MGLADVKTWLVKQDGIEAILHIPYWLSGTNDSSAAASWPSILSKVSTCTLRHEAEVKACWFRAQHHTYKRELRLPSTCV
jgi:hypothetical protein